MPDGEGGRSKGFPKRHRLRHRRLIRPLFDRGRSDVRTVAFGCVRLLYRFVPSLEAQQVASVQIGFAPGRARTAVTRNRVKRILREVYRNHQALLVDLFCNPGEVLTVMVLFRGQPAQASTCIPRDLPEALQRLAVRLARERRPT